MAEQFSLSDEYNNNEYIFYKQHEKDALQILFPASATEKWSVTGIYLAAEKAVPSLSREELNSVINHFQNSIRSREKFSLRFHFAPKQKQMRHAKWTGMVGRIIKLAKQTAAVVDTTPESSVATQLTLNVFEDGKQCPGNHRAEQKKVEELEDVNIPVTIFLRFLEDVEMCVAQVEALWKRVAAGEMRLATASMRSYLLPHVG